MKICIVVSESPLKVRKIAIYHFLIWFLFPELSMFKDLNNDQKMVSLSKYLSESFETLQAETTRNHTKDL